MQASSQTWSIDPAHTHVSFAVRHLGLTSTPGIFRQLVARLVFNEQQVEASSVTFDIDAASIDTAFAIRDEHLRGPDWLDTQAHPSITFASRSVRRVGGSQYMIDGDLTIRGVSLPLTFGATLIDHAVNPWTQAPVIGFMATASISRSAYGMAAFPGALSDTVQLSVATEITQQT